MPPLPLSLLTSQLHENLVQLEFAHYDVHNKGWVPGTDFAHSLLASSDVRTADMLLDRVGAPREAGAGRGAAMPCAYAHVRLHTVSHLCPPPLSAPVSVRAQAATMPAHLQKATIKWKDFSIMHQLRRKRHSIAVALNFMVKVRARA